MKSLTKDLQAVAKELKAITKKTERLVSAVDEIEKANISKKPKAKTKVKAKAAKKKAPAKKKATAPTATDQVLKIINRSKKGVDVPTLMNNTGFDEKKVRNIVSRAFSQGKIKRTGRGVYVGT
ncbi:MAG: hypothetical protein JW883_13520 [Deltaproteobacteria bacterium]|nr:hypothetical protein [Deltaproteobacteria bacterium]